MKMQNDRWTNILKQPSTPLLTRMVMLYKCESCKKMWEMWLQVGLEEGGENHKPVPYCIGCKCGGVAKHVLWHMDKVLENPIPIEKNMNYFENNPNSNCGIPILRTKVV
jgi:hypothetical protein